MLRTLRQRGCVVLPDQPLPLNSGPRVRELIRNLLQRSQLSVHLVGARYGAIPEDETESIVAIQNKLAAERCADPSFCRLIWMATGLETADDRQRAFLDRLRNDSDAQRGAEILPTTLEDLETVIDDKLKPKKKPENSPNRAMISSSTSTCSATGAINRGPRRCATSCMSRIRDSK